MENCDLWLLSVNSAGDLLQEQNKNYIFVNGNYTSVI